MSNITNLELQNSEELLHFFQRFTSVTNQIFVEINPTHIECITYTADKSLIKSSKVPLDLIFDSQKLPNEIVKFGIYSISNLIKIFSNFKSSYKFSIDWSPLEAAESNIGTVIHLRDKDLKIEFPCAGYNLFNPMEKSIFTKLTDVSTASTKFKLSFENLKKMYQLFAIDTDSKFLTFVIKDDIIQAEGKTFKYNISNSEVSGDNKVFTVFKSQLSSLDNEDQEVFIVDERIVFLSKNETYTIMSNSNDAKIKS